MTAIVQELPSASTCLAQISVDLGSLSEEFLQDMVKGMELDEALPPIKAVKKHLGEHPARLPQFMALVIREIHYGKALEYLEVIDGDEFFKQHLAEILDCLGPSRAYCCFAGLQYLKGGEALAKAFYAPHEGEGTGVDPLPADEKVDALVKMLLLHADVRFEGSAGEAVSPRAGASGVCRPLARHTRESTRP